MKKLFEILKNRKRMIFFFFPYYHTGGAEKVHLSIIKALKDEREIVFFTDRSRDRRFKKDFKKNIFCLSFFGVQNKIVILEKIFVLVISFLINNFKNPIVFGSNSRFFYLLTKRLNKNVKVIDLVHWLEGDIGDLAIKNTKKIDRRVVITPAIKSLLKRAYFKNGISEEYLYKIKLIENCVKYTESHNKDFKNKLNILYIGRNTCEKRVDIVVDVWRLLKNKKVNFTFIGRGVGGLFKNEDKFPRIIENISCEDELNEIYTNSHVILLSSEFEGFPMVFMEAMSLGVVPITTDVGGIPVHIKNGENGILIKEELRDNIVKKFVEEINYFNNDRLYLEKLSKAAYLYANENFFCRNFEKKYFELINEL